jgi:hypothetical protein
MTMHENICSDTTFCELHFQLLRKSQEDKEHDFFHQRIRRNKDKERIRGKVN